VILNENLLYLEPSNYFSNFLRKNKHLLICHKLNNFHLEI